MTKICTGCFCEKALTEFYLKKTGTPTAECKQCRRTYAHAWVEKNYERHRESCRDYQKKNPERTNQLKQQWKLRNAEQNKKINRRWVLNNPEQYRAINLRWKEKNPGRTAELRRLARAAGAGTTRMQRLVDNLRKRVKHALKGKAKSAATLALLGCGVEELRAHLERQFRPGMSWQTYGFWQIDHIKPCAKFDLRDAEQQKLCFHFSNLQPLWAVENRQKGDKC